MNTLSDMGIDPESPTFKVLVEIARRRQVNASKLVEASRKTFDLGNANGRYTAYDDTFKLLCQAIAPEYPSAVIDQMLKEMGAQRD